MNQEVTVFSPNEAIVQNFMPVFSPALMLQRYQVMKEIIDTVLKDGIDYGLIPGTDKKTLLKPGAEKLCTVFGLVPSYEYEQIIEDWGDGTSEPLFAYRIKCILWRNDYKAGEGMGFCSSRESKYRWRWVDEESAKRMGFDPSTLVSRDGRKREFVPDFALRNAETSGQFGKPQQYWDAFNQAIREGTARKVQREAKSGKKMDGWELEFGLVQYRIPNPDLADQINTVLKISMKRSYVAATISAANVSDRFTQDVEDFIEVEYAHAEKPEPAKSDPEEPRASTEPVKANGKVTEMPAKDVRTEAFFKRNQEQPQPQDDPGPITDDDAPAVNTPTPDVDPAAEARFKFLGRMNKAVAAIPGSNPRNIADFISAYAGSFADLSTEDAAKKSNEAMDALAEAIAQGGEEGQAVFLKDSKKFAEKFLKSKTTDDSGQIVPIDRLLEFGWSPSVLNQAQFTMKAMRKSMDEFVQILKDCGFKDLVQGEDIMAGLIILGTKSIDGTTLLKTARKKTLLPMDVVRIFNRHLGNAGPLGPETLTENVKEAYAKCKAEIGR